MKAIGIDLGGTNIKAAIVDQDKGIVEQTSIPTEANAGKEILLDRIAELAKNLASKTEVIGIGLGLPGMVALDQNTVMNPPNLPGWITVKAGDEISKRAGLQCRIENDANIAALGSMYFGVGRQFQSFIMVTLGTGVGGGIIYNRRLFKGTKGMAGEVGHVIINYDGPRSNSVTPGTAEAYLGQRFISNYARRLIMQNVENELYKEFGDNLKELEPVDIFRSAKEGNELAIKVLKESGKQLGYAIINYVHILDIRKIVLSGGVSKSGAFLIDPACDIVDKYMMEPFKEDFEIVQEDLGNNSALLGAAGLAFDSFS
ncbi:MAG: ROK family protein [Balneolaceae bacterium]|nr:ROK family protein [Balneolaceae bacterium]